MYHDHPLLDLRAFFTSFPCNLGEHRSPAELMALLAPDAVAPLQRDERVRVAVRDLLRQAGFHPTGRSKPASEYLVRATQDGTLSSINLAVDACNAVSLHSGLPISVVDCNLVREPLVVGIAAAGASYVFNPAGQVMDLAGLLCLFDTEGPCANPVKDSQRSKTSAATTRTLSLIWGTNALPGRAEQTESWYQQLLTSAGAVTTPALDSLRWMHP